MPGASAVLRPTGNAFADEPGLLQRPLLRSVVDVGHRLHSVGDGCREQPLGEKSLCLAAEALATGVGNEVDPDVPGPRLRVWPVPDDVPRHRADRPAALTDLDDHRAVLLLDEPALQRSGHSLSRLSEVVELAAILGTLPPLQQGCIVGRCLAEPDSWCQQS